MKKIICLIALSTLLAADASNHDRGKRREKRMPQMSPAVYATQKPMRTGEERQIAPEERAKFAAARKRRFEIMVLIGAYKIMPENERQPLRAELLKRIEADFNAMTADQKERIARAEADLKRLRKELAERENKRAELVNRELERLLKMQFPNRRKNNQHPQHHKPNPQK